MKTAQLLIIGALSSTLLSISGCGGSDITPAGDDNAGPLIMTHSPADDGEAVATGSAITATFNEDLIANSVTSNFTLTDSDGAVTVTASYDVGTRTASLTPEKSMKMLENHTATLTRDISDLSGNAYLGSSWSFTTADGTWGTEERLDTDDTGAATQVEIATDGNGGAIAVWLQNDGTRNNLMASLYSSSTGWGAPTLLDDNDNEIPNAASVAMDSSGNITVLWSQGIGLSNSLFTKRYDATGGWDAMVTPITSANVMDPKVLMDNSGNTTVIWRENLGTRFIVTSIRYTSGVWDGSSVEIEFNTTDSEDVQMAMDNNGNVIAVWIQSDGSKKNVWANRYVADGSWGTEELIGTTDLGDANSPEIAFDASGNAIVVWHQNNGLASDIWFNRYVSGLGWTVAEKIETDDANSAMFPEIAMDDSGNAIAVWYQTDGTQNNTVTNRYDVGTDTWGTAALIEDDNSGDVDGRPQIIMDSSGNAIAAWRQHDGSQYNINYNRYVAGTGWGISTLLETNDLGDPTGIKFALDNNGSVVATWYQQTTGGYYNIHSNRFE